MQPRLEESDTAVIFDALDRKGALRQAKRCEKICRKLPLKGEVVDREHGSRPWPAVIGEISECERRLPIVDVDDIGPQSRNITEPDLRRRPGERREPHGVVRPILAIGVDIGGACTREEVRRVERENVLPLLGENACPATEAILDEKHLVGTFEPRKHARIPRHERCHRNAKLAQSGRQRCGDIGETAGLHVRIKLGDDREDLHSLYLGRITMNLHH